jgi:hypothetical protein
VSSKQGWNSYLKSGLGYRETSERRSVVVGHVATGCLDDPWRTRTAPTELRLGTARQVSNVECRTYV